MLLLVQHVSPLGMLTALLTSLVWVFPLAVLGLWVLGMMLAISAPARFDPERSLLARATVRTPTWVLAGAVLLAALTWELRFLPSLIMISSAVLGLHARSRYGDDPVRIRRFCLLVPLAFAALWYLWAVPAVRAPQGELDAMTASLLLMPPGLAVLLTGPIPARVAPAVIRGAVAVAVVVAPFVLGTIFLRTPVLPTMAIELDAEDGDRRPPEVLLGGVISVDDRTTALLDREGVVRFIPNDRIRSQVLCPDLGRAPNRDFRLHGWHVEETSLEWLVPRRPLQEAPAGCTGRSAPTLEWDEPVSPPSG